MIPNFLFVFTILSGECHTMMNVPPLLPPWIIVAQKSDSIIGGDGTLKIVIQIPDLLAFMQTPNLIVVAQ